MSQTPTSPSARDMKGLNSSHGYANHAAPISEFNFSNELLANIKKNYEERVQELENHIRETYQLVETDEIVETMKMNQATDEFCKQRIQEIVDDSLAAEKEAQIEKLSHANAILKTEVLKFEEENQRILQLYNQDSSNYNKSFSELKAALQQTKQENENLTRALTNFAEQHESIIRQKDEAEKLLKSEVSRLRQEADNNRKNREDMERVMRKKDEIIEEMRRDIETLKDEFISLENQNTGLETEGEKLTRVLSSFQERTNTDAYEIQNLRKELEETGSQCKRLERENSDLITKSEYISSQVKKLVENGQKNTTEMIDEIKAKYQAKTDEQKRKLEEAASTQEDLRNEINSLISQNEDNKAHYEKIITQLQSDIKIVKEEWERRCQEITLNLQKEIVETEGKYQEQIGKMQTDFHTLLHKKLKEVQIEANEEISRIRNIEKELRSDLESKASQMDTDYILKSEHENILASEVLELKSRQMNIVRDLEEKYEGTYADKIQEIVDRNKNEYEVNLTHLKNQNKSLDNQIALMRADTQKVIENATKEKERYNRIHIEWQEANLLQKQTFEKLQELEHDFAGVGSLLDDELRKTKKKDIEIDGMKQKLEAASQKENELQVAIAKLKVDLTTMKNVESAQNEKISKSANFNKTLFQEIEIIKIALESSEKEKKNLMVRMTELECDLATANRSENEKQEILERLEAQILDNNQIKEDFTQHVNRVKILTKDVNVKEQNIVVLNKNIKELEDAVRRAEEGEKNQDNELIHWRENSRSLQKRLDRFEAENRKKVGQTVRILYREIDGLKQELLRFKSICSGEFYRTKSTISDNLNSLNDRIQEKVSLSRERYEIQQEKQISKLLEESLNEKEDYEDRIEKLNKNVTELTREADTLNRKLRDAHSQIEDAKDLVTKAEAKNTLLEQEKIALREESNKKVAEFGELQEFVENELRRLKGESNQVEQQMLDKYRQELNKILADFDQLRKSKVDKMRKLQEGVEYLEKQYERELQETKVFYEKINRDFEKDMIDAQKEVIEMKKQLRRENDNNDKLMEENRNMMVSFEEKLLSARGVGEEDKRSSIKERLTERPENQSSRQSLRASQVEFNPKVEGQKISMENLAEENFPKSRSSVNVRESERVSVKKQREKEIEDLQSLLTRTMQDVGRKGAKMTDRAERDIQEYDGRRNSIRSNRNF